MASGGKIDCAKKAKVVTLLTLVKCESPKLYELVSDLCLDGIFRSQKYEQTFLMPSDKVIKQIQDAVDADDDLKAINMIKSLLLKDVRMKEDFVKGAKIGTSVYNTILAKPEDIADLITQSKKSVVPTQHNAKETIVYNYSGPIPEIVEGKNGKGVRALAKGGQENSLVKKLTLGAIVQNNHKATIDNFFKLVAYALHTVAAKDPSRFDRIKYYMAANPIVCWFFLVMPGRGDAIVGPEDLKDFQWNVAVPNVHEIIKEAESSDGYKPNGQFLIKTKTLRSKLESFDRTSPICDAIVSAYKETNDVGNAMDKFLESHTDLKILMDESRFMYENSVNSWGDVSETIADLGAINWSEPQKYHIICSKQIYGKDCGKEMFMSGPMSFVKSIYFRYIPLTEEIESRLGGIAGGNPSAISRTIFAGGAARKHLKATPELKLSAFVSMLTKAQKEALKNML